MIDHHLSFFLGIVEIRSDTLRNPKIQKTPRPGIEPGSPTRQAGILTTVLSRMGDDYDATLVKLLGIRKFITFRYRSPSWALPKSVI